MNKFSKIYCPVTKKYINILSKKGRLLIKKYIKNYYGGGDIKGFKTLKYKSIIDMLLINDVIFNGQDHSQMTPLILDQGYFHILSPEYQDFLNTYIIYNAESMCVNTLIPTTRIKSKYSSVSCRLWQLLYILIVIFDSFDPTNSFIKNIIMESRKNPKSRDYNPMSNKIIIDNLFKICYLMEYLSTDLSKRNILGVYIRLCRTPHNRGYSIISSIDDLTKVPCLDYNIFPLFIYDSGNFTDPSSASSIIHYFTIIRFKKRLYLNSSWGDDLVRITQNTEELNIRDFNTYCFFIRQKPKTDEQKKFIIAFNKKYFFSATMALRHRWDPDTVEENPKLFSEWIMPEVGIREDHISYLLNNSFSIGLYINYIPMLKKMAEFVNQEYHPEVESMATESMEIE